MYIECPSELIKNEEKFEISVLCIHKKYLKFL